MLKELKKLKTIRERVELLRDKRGEVLAEKRLNAKSGTCISGSYLNKSQVSKEISVDATELNVKVIANTANWMDFDEDVLLRNASKKSIKERKHIIPHTYDHIQSVTAKVGDVMDIFVKDMTYKELGLKRYGEGSTEVLVFDTDIIKNYNEIVFEQYRRGVAKQHSIELIYDKLFLAVDSDAEDFEEEKKNWNKYYSQIINKDRADDKGYFFPVTEYKLLANSFVLNGSNEITETISVQPSENTAKEVAKALQRKKSYFINLNK